MKIMRFELPGSPGKTKVGFVDLGSNKVVDSATVLGRMGIVTWEVSWLDQR